MSSTGSVKDMERLYNQQIETLKRRQERSIKNMNDAHQTYKAELKKSHEGEIIDLQNENLRHVNLEAEKKEKVLAEMRGHLQSTQEITGKQLKELQENAAKSQQGISQKLSENREHTLADNQLALEEMNDRFQTETRKINQDGKNSINEMNRSMNEQYSSQQGHLQKKINDQSMAFADRFNYESREHQKMMDNALHHNKHERLNLNSRQQGEISKMTNAHTQLVEQRDTEYRKGLKEQDVFFEKKYKVNHEAHTKDANNLDERYNDMMNKMKIGLAREMAKTEERHDDPFYHLTELRPTWSRQEDNVVIKVKIPEYSKQDIQLFINGKEAILNFNRRYTDTNKSPDGISNKVSKVETFSARIPTDVFLNAKSVKSSYENGVMTYTIKQA